MEDGVTQRKNLVFAVNYEVSMVDQFLAHQRKRRPGQDTVEPVLNSTSQTPATKFVTFDTAPNPVTEDEGSATNNTTTTNSRPPPAETAGELENVNAQTAISSPTPSKGTPSRRKSARERPKRGLPLARVRVRYDMQLVPPAARNREFLHAFPSYGEKEAAPPRRSSRLNTSTTETAEPPPSCKACTSTPFCDDKSVLWIPSKRSEWEDSLSELTAVCTSAALRRFRSTPNPLGKPFHPPLSRDYIRDRVDIDDPLNGFQLRHKEGGWLQGFVLWTNFTTWTHYFKWDSLHPVLGLGDNNDTSTATTDVTGALTRELEAQPRSGDPHLGGVVFPTIAEIALLGGLQCGEYMLRLALESIRTSTAGYRYVVLQATDSSKTFYERFGFVRVGAVCRYGKSDGVLGDEPIQGYRHWTHANESERSLQKHGGPSCMMCLKLPSSEDTAGECSSCGSAAPSFLDQMLKIVVDEKPKITHLGATSTPLPKSSTRRLSIASTTSPPPKPLSRRSSSASLPDVLPSTVPKRARKVVAASKTPRRKSSPVPTIKSRPTPSSRPRPPLKHSLSMDSRDQPPIKRRRLETPMRSRDELLSPPLVGKSLSYAEKQYHSVWLAVPPTTEELKASRPPPKARGPAESTPLPAASSNKSTSKKVRSKTPVRVPRPPPEPLTLGPIKNPKLINKNILYKQKVRAYPRSRIHYYNRVVFKSGSAITNRKYWFVLQYDEATGLIKVVPLEPRGKLSGKREGRPRYQAEIGDTDANFTVVSTADYQLARAAMVMKTPVVAHEAWDIEDDPNNK